MSNVRQNRLSIELAVECLKANGFDPVTPNRPQGTYPHAHIVAVRANKQYFIGVASREEIGADGDYNHCYNIVKTAAELKEALEQARRIGANPSFVTIALRRAKGSYSAYFAPLQQVDFARCIPMKPEHRRRYDLLAKNLYDQRLQDLAT